MNGQSPQTINDIKAEVTVREYVDIRFQALEKAIEVEGRELDRRLEDLNKLREQVIEDRGQYVRKDAYDVSERERYSWRETMTTKVIALETRSITWTTAIGVFFAIIQVAVYFVLHR